MTTFHILKDLDTGDYMPNPLGTHQELVRAGSGIPPRLFVSEQAASSALRWWLRGINDVTQVYSSSLFEGECDEQWHTEPVPERKLRNMDVVEVEVDL